MNLTSEQLCDFFAELRGLVRAGIPLGQDLALSTRLDAPHLRALWTAVEQGMARGESLSVTLRGHAPQIGEATIALIRAGEESGDLASVLDVISQAHRRRVSLERTFRLVMAYPLTVLTFLVGLVLFFGLVILPQSQALARQIGAESLASTGSALTIATLSAKVCTAMASPPAIVVLVGGLAVLWIWLMSNAHVRPWVQSGFLAWVPSVGHLANLAAFVRWAHILGHLLERRVSMPAALDLANDSLGIPRLRLRAQEVRRQVDHGQPLWAAVLATGLLPPTVVGVLRHGEELGQVPAALDRIAAHLQDRLERRIERFLVLLEPAVILITGVIVFGVVVSLYLPVFLQFFNIPRSLL